MTPLARDFVIFFAGIGFLCLCCLFVLSLLWACARGEEREISEYRDELFRDRDELERRVETFDLGWLESIPVAEPKRVLR